MLFTPTGYNETKRYHFLMIEFIQTKFVNDF